MNFDLEEEINDCRERYIDREKEKRNETGYQVVILCWVRTTCPQYCLLYTTNRSGQKRHDETLYIWLLLPRFGLHYAYQHTVKLGYNEQLMTGHCFRYNQGSL